MKYRSVIYFWLSFISLITSLVIFAGGFIIVGVIMLFLGLITSYAYQAEYLNKTEGRY